MTGATVVESFTLAATTGGDPIVAAVATPVTLAAIVNDPNCDDSLAYLGIFPFYTFLEIGT